MKKRKLNTLLNNLADLTFGDYILFQEYRQGEHDGVQYKANVTSPIYAISDKSKLCLILITKLDIFLFFYIFHNSF